MIRPPARLLALTSALLLSGCCTDECLDTASGTDRNRVHSPRANLELVYNDTVSGLRRDRTDWRYVMLLKPGILTVSLHWDNGKANLELDIFDVMGKKIQEGRLHGTGELRALVAIEEPNPYYVRVRAAGRNDESQYAVRIFFKPVGDIPCPDNCKRPDRKCLDTEAMIACELIAPSCEAWKTIYPCEDGAVCRRGVCDPCASPCTEGTRRCASSSELQVCTARPGMGCPTWGPRQSCGGKHCREGRCQAGTVAKRCPATCPPGFTCDRAAGECVRPAGPAPAASSVKCRIISMYEERGKPTLHLDCGDPGRVRPGQIGTVLEGESNRPLPQGEIKILKARGHHGIASTRLQTVGIHRWVRIDTP